MEQKIVFPAYKKLGKCAGCGEVVYSPELQTNGGWPLMSACACAHGPDIASERETGKLRRANETATGEQARAA